MSHGLDEGRGALAQPLRHAAILGYDAIATAVGLHGALILSYGGFSPPEIAARTTHLTALLLALRLGAILLSGLHRWWFRASASLEVVRLTLCMLLASVAFAILVPGLLPSVYVLDFFLATSGMAAFRFGPRFVETLFQGSAARDSQAKLASAEGPRRFLNVIVAVAGLIATSPLWVLIAIAIKATSRGPVFYSQERIGLDLRASRPLVEDPRRKKDLGGRPFMIYKFRTMRIDAEAQSGPVWSGKEDPRVTWIGRILRQYRLDELPQLINVLKGEMNVVGPRPERPSIFAELRQTIPNYATRQRVRPGITGYAQVNLEYDSSIEDVSHKLRFDLEYISRQSFRTDLWIMARTLPVMLFRDKMLASAIQDDKAAPALGVGEKTSG